MRHPVFRAGLPWWDECLNGERGEAVREMVTVAPGVIEVRDAAEPRPSAGEAIIDVAVVGLCGSDLHLYTGDHPYSHFPLVQGHEISGWVRSLPDDYAGPLKAGDLVAVEPYFSCGTCFPCRRGRANCCTELSVIGAQVDGALRDTIAVDVGKLHAVPGLTPELAALVEPISIGAMAVSRSGVQPGDQVLIIGAGPIGQAILLAASEAGASVAMADRLPARLELARELGAELAIDTSRDDLAESMAQWTRADGPAIVFEATGVPMLVRLATDLVAPSGTVVIVGLSTDDVSIPVVDFTRKELNVLGSRAGTFPAAVKLVASRAADVQKLISHRFALEAAGDAMRIAIDRPGDVEKVLVTVG
jgi:L-gulonate 5-dehydrogenase